MEEYYSLIRHVHIAAVFASGSLFALRGLGLNVLNLNWMMAAPLRYSSYMIDTVLLVAAILLAGITRQYPFVDAWLTTKILLLLLYIVLGSFALKRGRTRTVRIICWISAMAVFCYIIGVAQTRSPLMWFAG